MSPPILESSAGGQINTRHLPSLPSQLQSLKHHLQEKIISMYIKRMAKAKNHYEHTYMLHAGTEQHCQIPGCFPPARSLGICPRFGKYV